MINNSVVRKVVQVEYSMLRTPLAVVDRRLVTRYLSDDSKLRLSLERGLGSLDAAVGRLVGDPSLRRRGDALRDYSDLTGRAAALDTEAERLRAAATETDERAASEAEEIRDRAQQEERGRVAEALRTEQEEKQLAGELADADAEEKKRQTELRAKHLVEEFEQERKLKQARIDRQAAAATAPAKAALQDAAKDKSAAAKRRAEAKKLAELAKTEGQTRTRSRARST